MEQHLRRRPDGSLAWEQRLFVHSPPLCPVALIDAAVDIVWDQLLPRTLEHPPLDIHQHDGYLVFRLKRSVRLEV